MRLVLFIVGLVVLITGGIFGALGLFEAGVPCAKTPVAAYLTGLPTCDSTAAVAGGLLILGGLLFIAGLIITIVGAVLEESRSSIQQVSRCPQCGYGYSPGQYIFCPACGRRLQGQ